MTLTPDMGRGHWPPEQPRDELPWRVSHQEAARILANRAAREIAAEVAVGRDPSHLKDIFMWLRRIEDESPTGDTP